MMCCHFVFAYFVVILGGYCRHTSSEGLRCATVLMFHLELGATSPSLTCDFVPHMHKKQTALVLKVPLKRWNMVDMKTAGAQFSVWSSSKASSGIFSISLCVSTQGCIHMCVCVHTHAYVYMFVLYMFLYMYMWIYIYMEDTKEMHTLLNSIFTFKPNEIKVHVFSKEIVLGWPEGLSVLQLCCFIL